MIFFSLKGSLKIEHDAIKKTRSYCIVNVINYFSILAPGTKT